MPVDPIANAARACYAQEVAPEVPPWLREEVRVGAPLKVTRFDGPGHYWFVPLVARGREIGFMYFTADTELVRHGVRVSDPKSLHAFPQTVTEMTGDEVRSRATAEAGPGSVLLSQPQLVYLEFNSKLSWACRLRRPNGQIVTVFVTPQLSWTQS